MNDALVAVSIIIPCRNRKDYFENRVWSILTPEPLSWGFEKIVANSMFDDGTQNILKRIAAEDAGHIVSTGLNTWEIRGFRGQVL